MSAQQIKRNINKTQRKQYIGKTIQHYKATLNSDAHK